MPEPGRQPATTSGGSATASADGGGRKLDGVAISPAVGPLPAIYVPQSPSEPGATGLLWHAGAQAARRARIWYARHLPHHDPGPPARDTSAASAPPAKPKASPIGETMPEIPDGLRYSEDHLWVRADASTGLARVGLTDFAQQSLGDVVEVTPPRPGETITAGEACGDVESTKSVSDLIAPVSGTVRARNDDLTRTPELVNTDPYGQGWMFETETDVSTLTQQLASLRDPGAYRELTGE